MNPFMHNPRSGIRPSWIAAIAGINAARTTGCASTTRSPRITARSQHAGKRRMTPESTAH